MAVVVVTGASAGVGRAAALAFGARGDQVALLARGEAGLHAAASEVRAAGGQALPISVDVAEHVEVEAAAATVESTLGPIDVWVNDAFSSVFGPFMSIGPEDFRHATDVTYLGFVNGTRAALRRMLPRDRGVVVQVGSALAYRGLPLQSAYCGAKHAIQGFNESLRCELMHQRSGVRVTMVQMPALNTPQFTWLRSKLRRHAQPVPPIYQPEVASSAIVYAADHPKRREYWVGGSTVGTLLANAVAPGLLDRYLARTGFSSQQTGEPHDPDDPGNLWRPLDGQGGPDYGTYGEFTDKAKGRSAQQWVSRRRGTVGLIAAGAGAAAGVGAVTLRHKRAR